MAYRFVSLRDGERHVHWMKLGAFAALTFAAVPAVIELAWYRVTGTWSTEALVVSGLLGCLIVIRSALRAFSIPEAELTTLDRDDVTKALPGESPEAGPGTHGSGTRSATA